MYFNYCLTITKGIKLKDSLKWPYTDLVNGNLAKTYQFDDKCNFKFKLVDNDILLKKVQSALKCHTKLGELVDEQYLFIDELKATKLWLDIETSIISMSLYDVYTGLMKHLKDQSFEDQLFNCHDVSFVGPMGPFKEMPLIKCLNDNIVEKLILHSLLKNKIPSRKLRVHTQGKVIIRHGEELKNTEIVNIRQITDSGILLSSTDDLLLQKISKSDQVKFLVDTELLKEFTGNGLKITDNNSSEFFYTTNDKKSFLIQESEIVKTLSYKSGDNNEFYLFCRYQHMLETDASKDFKEFTNTVKDYFEKLVA